MTKVQAIVKVMQQNGGSATLQQIYENSGRFYRGVKRAEDWKAGLRGVLYREINKGRTFKKIDSGTYGLIQPAFQLRKDASNSRKAARLSAMKS